MSIYGSHYSKAAFKYESELVVSEKVWHSSDTNHETHPKVSTSMVSSSMVIALEKTSSGMVILVQKAT